MSEQVKFLMAEDNDAHAKLITRSLKKGGVVNCIERVENGEEVVEYLQSDKKLPDVILLDINMPKMDGIDTIKWIKAHDNYKHIPVVILTTSLSRTDRMNAYENYVNSYLVKPIDFEDFHKMVRDLGLYWSIWNTPQKNNLFVLRSEQYYLLISDRS